MILKGKEYFKTLLTLVEQRYKSSYPDCISSISDWRKNDILRFQDHLSEITNGRVSEKWFYTHVKSEAEKLPREDTLNLLAKYVGFEDWNVFVHQSFSKQEGRISYKKKLVIAALVVIVLISITAFMNRSTSINVEFCFYDAHTNRLIAHDIEVHQLFSRQSSVLLECKDNCVRFNSEEKVVKIVVESPYYQNDTFIRQLARKNWQEKVKLVPDDYALSLDYLSNSKVEDWKRRRKELGTLIHNSARIYRVDANENVVLEIFNKQEYINKLSLPVRRMKKTKLLDIQYRDNQIYKLKFVEL